jgi:hypothetical protein
MDKTYDSIYADFLEGDLAALAEFQSGISTAFPGAELFSDLDESDQDAYLTTHHNTEFFETLRFKTLAGVFAMASYGGNRDGIGWKLLGMDGPPHAWSYPFGYYDADYMEQQSSSAQARPAASSRKNCRPMASRSSYSNRDRTAGRRILRMTNYRCWITANSRLAEMLSINKRFAMMKAR